MSYKDANTLSNISGKGNTNNGNTTRLFLKTQKSALK